MLCAVTPKKTTVAPNVTLVVDLHQKLTSPFPPILLCYFGLVRSHWSLVFQITLGLIQRIQFVSIQRIKTVQLQIEDVPFPSKISPNY